MIRILILLLTFGIITPRAKAELSLALVPENEAARPAADLLLAELSSEPGLRLLERAELQRIVSEQSLSLANSQDLLRIGKLAGADSLLLLDHFSRVRESGQSQQFIGLRLILVQAGVVLHTADYAWPVPDPSEWSRKTARALVPQFGKARVSEASALKLSLLNLRSATASMDSRLLEQELNGVLLKRLARETNIFVLERQKLGATLLERELNSEAAPFWQGSYLIDGTVNKQGYNTNLIQIEGRVVSPGGKVTNVIELTEARGEVPKLIDRLVLEVLKAANLAPSGSWDRTGEAARYFEEAGWSLRWGLWREAQSAADAAWALGKQDEAAASRRVEAYSRASKPQTGIRYSYPQRRRKSFEKPPQAESLPSGIAALSIFLDWSRRMGVEKAGKQWVSVGLGALENASQLLSVYYFTQEARDGHEEELAELRGLCRQTAEWLASAPSVRAPFFLDGAALSIDEIRLEFEHENLFTTMARYGALWQERMADALRMQSMLISAPSFGLIRKDYFGDPFNAGPVAGWKWNERMNALPVWREFLADLEKSTNLVTCVNAKILKCGTLSLDSERHERIREILGLLRANQEELGKHPSPLRYEHQLEELVGLASNVETPEREALKREIRLAETTVMQPIERAQEAASLFPQQKQFLQNLEIDFSQFTRLFPPSGTFAKGQAEALAGLLAHYRAGLTNLLKKAEARDQGKIRNSLALSAHLEDRLNEMLGKRAPVRPPVSASNQVPASPNGQAAGLPEGARKAPTNVEGGGAIRPRPVGPFGRGGQPEPLTPTAVRTNRLVVDLFQRLPPEVMALTNVSDLRNTSYAPAGSNIWLRSWFIQQRPENGYRREERGVIALFNPESGVREIIPTDFEQPVYHSPFSPMAPDFQVWKGDLYAAGGSELRKYDRARQEWQTLPVPLSRSAQVFALDGHLLILNADSLQELEGSGAGAKTLASSRRNPPVTPLDTLTNLSAGSLFGAADGFRAWVPPSLYQFRSGTFSLLQTFRQPGRVSSDPHGFLYLEFGASKHPVYWMGEADENPVVLFTQQATDANRWRPAVPNGMNEVTNAVWAGLNRFAVDVSSAVVVGEDIFMWGGPAVKAAAPEVMPPTGPGLPPVEKKAHLWLLSRHFKEPVAFETEMAAGIPLLREHPLPKRFPPATFITATREHLVFGNYSQPGLWFVPLAKLKEAADSAKLILSPGTAQ